MDTNLEMISEQRDYKNFVEMQQKLWQMIELSITILKRIEINIREAIDKHFGRHACSDKVVDTEKN